MFRARMPLQVLDHCRTRCTWSRCATARRHRSRRSPGHPPQARPACGCQPAPGNCARHRDRHRRARHCHARRRARLATGPTRNRYRSSRWRLARRRRAACAPSRHGRSRRCGSGQRRPDRGGKSRGRGSRARRPARSPPAMAGSSSRSRRDRRRRATGTCRCSTDNAHREKARAWTSPFFHEALDLRPAPSRQRGAGRNSHTRFGGGRQMPKVASPPAAASGAACAIAR